MDRSSIRDWTWRLIVLAIAFILAIVMPPALAHAATAATADQGPVDVPLPAILAPMVVQNRLAGYAYITITLAPNGRDKVNTIREKMPFLRDAFLREVNKVSILKADDPKTVDSEGVKTRLTARMNQILPTGTVMELKVQQIVLAPFNS
jgi:flagellar basal body-associated protein FliL